MHAVVFNDGIQQLLFPLCAEHVLERGDGLFVLERAHGLLAELFDAGVHLASIKNVFWGEHAPRFRSLCKMCFEEGFQ